MAPDEEVQYEDRFRRNSGTFTNTHPALTKPVSPLTELATAGNYYHTYFRCHIILSFAIGVDINRAVDSYSCYQRCETLLKLVSVHLSKQDCTCGSNPLFPCNIIILKLMLPALVY